MTRRYEKIDWNDGDPTLIVDELDRRCDERCGLHLTFDDLTAKAQERITFEVRAQMEAENLQRFEDFVVDAVEFA